MLNLDAILKDNEQGGLARENYAVSLGDGQGTLYLDMYYETFPGAAVARFNYSSGPLIAARLCWQIPHRLSGFCD